MQVLGLARRIRRRPVTEEGGRRPRPFVPVVTMVVLASVAVSCSKSSTTAKTGTAKIKSAEEQYKTKNGVYGTQDQLVAAKFLTAPVADRVRSWAVNASGDPLQRTSDPGVPIIGGTAMMPPSR